MTRLVTLGLIVLLVTAGIPAVALAEDEGEAVFKQNCLGCHPAEKILVTPRTRAEWKEVISKMILLGAPLRSSRKKQEAVLDYLVRTRGWGDTAGESPGKTDESKGKGSD